MSNDRNIKTDNNMKLKKKINQFNWLLTALLLVAAMVVPSVAWAVGITPSMPTNGDGSADNPYQIGTAAELYWFAGLVNGDSNVCTDGVTQNSAACAELTENIVVNQNVLDANGNLINNGSGLIRWTTIGNESTWYTGTFDGNGKTISGLYFNNGGQSYVGLFGWISGGTIKNVGVVDSYINGGHNTGGLCGQNNGTISNCYYIGSVSGIYYVGGLCGNNTRDCTISNCYSIGSVSGNGNNVGGFCGMNYGTIKHCYYNSQIYTGNAVGQNNGNVEKVEGKTTAQFKSGEVAWLLNEGTADGTQVWYQTLGSDDYPVFDSGHKTVRQCSPCTGVYTNTNDLSAQHDYGNGDTCLKCGHSVYETATLIDGVYQIGNYSQLYWFAQQVNNDNEHYGNAKAVLTADITVNTDVLDESGNLVSNVSGFRSWTPIGNSSSNAYSGTFDGQGHTISGLYFNNTETDSVGLFGRSSGTIKNLGVVNSYIKGNKYVGAVCGSNNVGGKIENCYNAGYVDGNRHQVGGLCGSNNGEIACSYNKGTVAGAQLVGGVCGLNENGTIANCYNAGSVSGTGYNIGGVCGINRAMEQNVTSTITNCYNIGNVSGSEIVGGVCGNNATDNGGSSTITNCYNIGNVSGSENVGGVCGQNYGKINNCYYNSNNYSGNAIDVNNGNVEKVEGKTTAQFESGEVAWLLNGSTSEGNLAWYQNIGSGTLDGYPVLDNNHQVVVACTLPESTPHGNVKVSYEDGTEISKIAGNKIFATKSSKVNIEAIPKQTEDVNYKVKSFKVLKGETDITSNDLILIEDGITITAEFTLDWFVVNGVKYKVMELGGDNVKVVAITGTDIVIPATVPSPDLGVEPTKYTIKEIATGLFSTNTTKIKFEGETVPNNINNAFDNSFRGKIIVPALYVESYLNDFNDDLKDKINTDKALITLFPGSCGKIKVYVVNEDSGNADLQDIIDNNKVVVDWGKTVKIEAVANSGYGVSWLKIDGEQQRGNSYTTTLEGGNVVEGKIVGNIKAEASFYYIIPSVFMYDDVCYEKRWDANYWEEVTVRNLNYFYYDKHYTGDLELPEKVEYYGSYYKVTAINERAFSGSSELRSVVLPSVMNKIGSYAFEGCTGLEKLVVKSPSAATRAATTEPTVPTVDEHAFDDICETAVLYVPENWKEAFKAAPEWRKFFEVKEQREDGTVLAELTMTSTYGGTLAVGEIVSESDTRIVKVAEGSSVTVEVTPREGYMLTNLSYDGTDVMDQLVDGKLTLTGISGEKYITAVFGIDTGIGGTGASSQKVFIKDGRIVVDGVAAGEGILIYNALGQLLRREVANGERLEIPMTAGQMYVVKIGKKIVKI